MHAIRPGIRGFAGASLIALIASAAPAYAAADPVIDAPLPAAAAALGTIVSGRVYDSTGVALPGARVVVGTGVEATTNLQGEFTVAAPDATGAVELLIDYLGRPPVTRTVTAAERGNAVSFTLPAAGANEGDIVVTGASLLDDTARALNQQRSADNTITVISADAIGRFPDPNIAEALQRAPGISARIGGAHRRLPRRIDQGDNAYTLYRLPNVTYAGRFRINGGAIDGTSDTDGIELAFGDFGPHYSKGLLVAQEGDTAPDTQNFKYASWAQVLKALDL